MNRQNGWKVRAVNAVWYPIGDVRDRLNARWHHFVVTRYMNDVVRVAHNATDADGHEIPMTPGIRVEAKRIAPWTLTEDAAKAFLSGGELRPQANGKEASKS